MTITVAHSYKTGVLKYDIQMICTCHSVVLADFGLSHIEKTTTRNKSCI